MARVNLNGVGINVEVSGEGEPLLLLHGFTGSTATWASHLPALSRRFRTITVDVLGHGLSDAPLDPERYRMERCVEDLLALLDYLNIEHLSLLGYSMGGRIAMHLAVSAPVRIRSLILESASPGIADPADRQKRVYDDNVLADRIEREGVASFVDYWAAIPLFQSQSGLPEAVRVKLRDQRLRNKPHGLANSLRGMGAGRQEPLHDRLGQLKMPVLLIVGELDRKYCQIARQMQTSLPNVKVITVPDAGHTVHLEQPEVFDQAVLQFLSENTQKGREPNGS
jgi:2-succinyl-6-hydroxy-2,4-cyclohexadiene-1-carboxylate synthase